MAGQRIWDYLNALSHSKDTSVLDDPDFDKLYQPFVINKVLARTEDAVLAAQLMNEKPELDKKLQFLFLLNTLRARKRYGTKDDKTVDSDVAAVAEYYECSPKAAREFVSLHTVDQIKTIYRRIEKGGTSTKVHGNAGQNSTAPCSRSDTRLRGSPASDA